jgi:hypothetical protein
MVNIRQENLLFRLGSVIEGSVSRLKPKVYFDVLQSAIDQKI